MIKSPFDGDDVIIAIGDFGYGVIDAFVFRCNDDDYEFPEERLCDAIGTCEYIDGEDLDDVLVIVEMCDDVYKRAREDEKIEQTLKETKRKMVM